MGTDFEISRQLSPPHHRRIRAKRSTVRHQLKGRASQLNPHNWLGKAVRVLGHHSKPFSHYLTIFPEFCESYSMPSYWKCRCNATNALTNSFCGTCGLRWDKALKSNGNKGTAASKKSDQGPEIAKLSGFNFPSVGLPVQVHSQASSSAAVPASDQNMQPQQKSVKALLHQKANKIGKLETRLKRLTEAMAEVEQRWPVYVQKVQQQLKSEHQQVVEFTQGTQAEATTLQAELQQLMAQSMQPINMQVGAPLPAMNMTMPCYTHTGMHIPCPPVGPQHTHTVGYQPQLPAHMPYMHPTHICASDGVLTGFQIPNMHEPGPQPLQHP